MAQSSHVAAASPAQLLEARTAAARINAAAPGAHTLRATVDGSLPRALAAHLPVSGYASDIASLEAAARAAVSTVIDGSTATATDPSSSARPAADGLPSSRADVAGLAERFGFHGGAGGGAASARDGLIADLIGGAGPVPSLAQAISRLHETTFANYTLWATYIGADLAVGPAAADPQDVHMKLCELALWYLIRSEAGILRFCPELLCWLFAQMRRPHLYIAPRPLSMSTAAPGGGVPAGATSTSAAGETSIAGAATTGVAAPMAAAAEAGPIGSFFHVTTIRPLYDLLKEVSTLTIKKDHSAVRHVCCCCVPRAAADAAVPVPNYRRPNLDDLNEAFWQPAVLRVTYHCLDADRGVQSLRPLRKSFRERSSFLALVTNTYSYWLLATVFALACLAVALTIAERGGSSIADLGVMSFGFFLTRFSAYSMLALTAGKLIHVLLGTIHSAPSVRSSRSGAWRRWSAACSWRNALKVAYHAAWAAGLWVVYWIGPGVGSGAWWGIVAARLVFLLLGNGIAHGLVRRSGSLLLLRAEYLLAEVERVYTAVPAGGPLAGNLLRQSAKRVLAYTAVWVFILGCKFAFDITILAQTARTARDVEARSFPLAWGYTSTGADNVWISIGLWITAGIVLAIDTYVAVSIVVPLLATAIVRWDGIGSIRTMREVTDLLLLGVASNHHRHRNAALEALGLGSHHHDGSAGSGAADRSLPTQFLRKCLPQALEAQRVLAAAAGTQVSLATPPEVAGWLAEAQRAVSANAIFGAAWNGCIRSMRENDLLSDAEAGQLTYGRGLRGVAPEPTEIAAASAAGSAAGSAAVGNRGAPQAAALVLSMAQARNIVPQQPLFLYGGPIRATLDNPHRLLAATHVTGSDAQLLAWLQRENPMLLAAITELRAALPQVLYVAAKSHPRVRPEDSAGVWAAIIAALEPAGTDWHSIIVRHFTAGYPSLPQATGLATLGRPLTDPQDVAAFTRQAPPAAHVIDVYRDLLRFLRLWCNPGTVLHHAGAHAATASQQDIAAAAPHALYASLARVLVGAYALVCPEGSRAAALGGQAGAVPGIAGISTTPSAVALFVPADAASGGSAGTGSQPGGRRSPLWLSQLLQAPITPAAPLRPSLLEQLDARGLGDDYFSHADHAQRALLLLEQPPGAPGIRLRVEEVSRQSCQRLGR